MRTHWIAALTILGAVQTAYGQVVFSESFEQPVIPEFVTFNGGQVLTTAGNGWAISSAGVVLFHDSARPEEAVFEGQQAVDLSCPQGPGSMATTFETVEGRTYTLEFHYARNANLGETLGRAEVQVICAGIRLDTVIEHDPGQHPFDEYLQYQFVFTADATQAMLRFTSLNSGSAGITVDAITVTESSATCGSADFDCDGDLGTDADIESFFRCLAGTCPDQCLSNADFNGDGDIGTDADVEAFFRVLAGGTC